MSGSTFYDILGIDPNASPEDIRKAYKKRALETHPDRLPQGSTPNDKTAAAEAFRRVNNAYEILTDADKRKLYDLYGVWPPPEELPDDTSRNQGQPRPSRRSHHPNLFHHPFFSDTVFGHHPPPPVFVFRDPFEVFHSFFPEHGMHQDPFQHFVGPRGFANGPQLMFPNMFSSHPGFSPFHHHDHTEPDPTGRYFSFQSSSSSIHHQPFNGNDGNPPRWVSQSTTSRTVNGVTHVMKQKVDSHGNVHLREVYPDGGVKYSINGVEQSRPPSRIPDVPSGGRLRASHESDHPGELSRESGRRRESERHRDSQTSRGGYVPPPFLDSDPYIPPPAHNDDLYSSRLGFRNEVSHGDFGTSGVDFLRDPPPKKSWWKRH